MPGFVILSDDFWLVGPSFTNYIDIDVKPEGTDVEEIKPESLAVVRLRPTSGTVDSEGETYEDRPVSVSAKPLKPIGSVTELRPTSVKVEEDN